MIAYKFFHKEAGYQVEWLENDGEQTALDNDTLKIEEELNHILQSSQAKIVQLERENAHYRENN